MIAAFFTFRRLNLDKGTTRQPWGSFIQIMQSSIDFRSKELPSLLSLLEMYREMKSTDPRDKVFGLLGIADPKDVVSLGIEVDYRQDVTTIYTQLAKGVIRRDKDLGIFACLGFISKIKELPTWVPDWTLESELPYPFETNRNPNVCQAGGRTRFSKTGKLLEGEYTG